MAKKKKSFPMSKKTIGITLLIALALMFVPIPFINGSAIGQVLVFLIALYELIF